MKVHCYKCGIERKWWRPSHWIPETTVSDMTTRWYCPDHKEAECRWIERSIKEEKKRDRAAAEFIKKEAAKVNAIKGKVCTVCGINLESAQDKRVWDAQMTTGLLTNRLGPSLLSDEKMFWIVSHTHVSRVRRWFARNVQRRVNVTLAAVRSLISFDNIISKASWGIRRPKNSGTYFAIIPSN